ncbi:hypothetical protein ABCR94_06880 [Streptomyces sp. 21So2-11]|uniref:hypothetical protein n=1 Tax=Streptomyces sp. 21So2-11 TaxID=3144408 RepID=UPI00321AE4AC
MSAQTKPHGSAHITGVCRIGEHKDCHGNDDIKAGGVVALKLRCACDCHKPLPRPVARRRRPGRKTPARYRFGVVPVASRSRSPARPWNSVKDPSGLNVD